MCSIFKGLYQIQPGKCLKYKYNSLEDLDKTWFSYYASMITLCVSMSIILLLKHLCIKRNKYYDLTTSIQTIGRAMAMAASQRQAKGAGSLSILQELSQRGLIQLSVVKSSVPRKEARLLERVEMDTTVIRGSIGEMLQLRIQPYLIFVISALFGIS